MAYSRGNRKRGRAATKKNEDCGGDGCAAAASDMRDGGEILWLVFQHLPLRVLFQCKSVCRSWNSVISDPYFRRQYLSNSPRDTTFLIDMEISRDHRKRGRNHWRRICSIPRFRFSSGAQQPQGPVLEEICASNSRCFPASTVLVGSSSGLLLLNNRNLDRYLIYNPLTRAAKELPLAPRTHIDHLTSFFCQEPEKGSKSSNSYQFQVVLIPSPSPDSPKIRMYSSRNSLWSTHPVSLLLCYTMSVGPESSRQVVVEGKVYWAPKEQLIGVFDPRTGHVTMLPLPRHRNCYFPCLGKDDSGRLLCGVWDNNGFDVLLLRQDATRSPTLAATDAADGLWTRIHQVEYLEIAMECSFPVEELNSGKRMMFFGAYILLSSSTHRLHVIYHMRSRKSRRMRNDSRPPLSQLCAGHIILSRVPYWPFCLLVCSKRMP